MFLAARTCACADFDASVDVAPEVFTDASVLETAGEAGAEADVKADVVPSDARDTAESDAPMDAPDAVEASLEADSVAEAEAETPEPLNRCKGKRIAAGHVVILFNTPASLPSGFPTFAGAINATVLLNPYPGCSSSTPFPGGFKTYRCDVGTPAAGSVVRFVIGAAVASGDSIKPLYYSRVDGGTFSADGEIVACESEVEIGSYTSASGFLGKLRQWGTSEKFELALT